MADASNVKSDFESWLSLKLNSFNTDVGVFCDYISGILIGEESIEEKTEALEGILAEITENDLSSLSREILDKWHETHQESTKNNLPSINVEEKLVKLLENNLVTTVTQKEHTTQDKKLRDAILAQYSQTSDQDSGNDDGPSSSGLSDPREKELVKNTNALSVAHAEREKREKAKLDSQKKKDKDREDREKQKQQAADKKEKRKTQKGERRR